MYYSILMIYYSAKEEGVISTENVSRRPERVLAATRFFFVGGEEKANYR
jgi:hypothetical protein